MAKKAKQSKKSTQQYKEDILFFRMSMLFILACAAVIFIFRLKNTPSNAFHRLAAQPAFLAVLAVPTVLTFVYWVICRKNHKDESERSFSSANYFAVMAYIFLFSLYWGWTLSPRYGTVITLTIALPLLYFIYHIYKRDFFIFSAANLIFLATIWFFNRGGLKYTIAAGVCLALSAYSCYYGYRMSQKYAHTESYRYSFEPISISFLIMVVLVVLLNVLHLSFLNVYIVWIVMLFQYLTAGIYYTIKLLREA